MTIYVDEIKVWPSSVRCFKAGSCHLFTNGAPEELHAFAAKLGLRRGWFQPHPLMPHYDLTPVRRVKAVALGATEVSMREYLRRAREAEGKAGWRR